MKSFYWFIFHLVLGLWLLMSPYVLGFTEMQEAYWNSIATGIVFVVSSAFGLYLSREEVTGERLTHKRAA